MPAITMPTSPASSAVDAARVRVDHVELLHLVLAARAPSAGCARPRAQAPVDHAHQQHDAHVRVEPGIEDQRAQRRVGIARRAAARARRCARAARRCPAPSFADTRSTSSAGETDHVLDLLRHALGIRRRQVDLVQRSGRSRGSLRPRDRRWRASAPRCPAPRRPPAPRPRRRTARATPRRRSRRGRACRSGSARSPGRRARGSSMRAVWALIVMPRSRSRSILSRNWSRFSRAAERLVTSSSRSASVLLPWSMCAMMQKLRMWSCAITGPPAPLRAPRGTTRRCAAGRPRRAPSAPTSSTRRASVMSGRRTFGSSGGRPR